MSLDKFLIAKTIQNKDVITAEVNQKKKMVTRAHYVKNVRIWSYSGPYFPAFGLNTERCEVSLRIQSECGKIRTRVTSNTQTFHAVILNIKKTKTVQRNSIKKELCKELCFFRVP